MSPLADSKSRAQERRELHRRRAPDRPARDHSLRRRCLVADVEEATSPRDRGLSAAARAAPGCSARLLEMVHVEMGVRRGVHESRRRARRMRESYA